MFEQKHKGRTMKQLFILLGLALLISLLIKHPHAIYELPLACLALVSTFYFACLVMCIPNYLYVRIVKGERVPYLFKV